MHTKLSAQLASGAVFAFHIGRPTHELSDLWYMAVIVTDIKTINFSTTFAITYGAIPVALFTVFAEASPWLPRCAINVHSR